MRRHSGESFVPRPHFAFNYGAQFFREGERVIGGRPDRAVEMAGESDDDTTNIFFAHYFGYARDRVFVLRPFDRLDGMRQKLQLVGNGQPNAGLAKIYAEDSFHTARCGRLLQFGRQAANEIFDFLCIVPMANQQSVVCSHHN